MRVADEVFRLDPVLGLPVMEPVIEPVREPLALPVWRAVVLDSESLLDPVSWGEFVDPVGVGVALAEDEPVIGDLLALFPAIDNHRLTRSIKHAAPSIEKQE